MHLRRSLVTLLLALVALAWLGVALADGGGGFNPNPGDLSNEGFDPRSMAQRARDAGTAAIRRAQELVQVIETGIDAFRTDNRLASAGRHLLGLLGFVVIAWAILKNMLLKPGLPQLVADLIFPLVVIALGVTAISGNLGNLIAGVVEGLASTLGSSPADQRAAASRFMGRIGNTIHSVWGSTPAGPLFGLGSSYFSALLLQLVAVAFLCLAGAIGLGVLFMAKLQLALACMLGPIMIPWLLWKPTEFLFSGWLTFLIRSGFIVVAVYAIERVLSSSMENLSRIASSADVGVDSAVTYGMIALMAMLFAFLLLKSAEIGAGIVSGSVVGFGGFTAISNGALGGAIQGAAGAGARRAGRMAGQGAEAAGRLAGRGAVSAGKVAAGYAKGYLHGRGPLSAAQKATQPERGTLARSAYALGRKHGA